ncbi:Hypothetical protein R9X50_00206400 [Acrodontium crateriforme]|uniref:PQ loop repeat protein n=1 Tax=Acrodontium crateriforme TaxID=150365 RepID=A0AAQ3M098_9PEZI|nr:Hypothetical protein R9X50_00206400 [Acrodontium crateriforme]
MSWLSPSAFIEPALPPHCEPTSDFLFRFSSAFHTCVPTPLAFLSNVLGICSIISWLFAQLPQIYKNWSISSTSGLSIFFLLEWCLGDMFNLLGALFTHQAPWQVTIAGYYVFVDLCLVGQWFWYEKLRHGNNVRRVLRKSFGMGHDGSGGDMEEVVIAGDSEDRDNQPKAKQPSHPRIIFRTPTFERYERINDGDEMSPNLAATPSGSTFYKVGPSSLMPSPSPRTMLLIACVIALAQASPLSPQPSFQPGLAKASRTPLEIAGTVFSWGSTFLYLGSRLPQLIKNWRRKSTAGLSPHLFLAAFCGNLFYSAALLTNPLAWSSMGPYGGGGWAGPEGNDRTKWVTAALPFFLGAAGVLGLDASVGVQFALYGEGGARVIVVEDARGRKWHWRQVSGWMRGWIPGTTKDGNDKRGQREALLERSETGGDGYGSI